MSRAVELGRYALKSECVPYNHENRDQHERTLKHFAVMALAVGWRLKTTCRMGNALRVGVRLETAVPSTRGALPAQLYEPLEFEKLFQPCSITLFVGDSQTIELDRDR